MSKTEMMEVARFIQVYYNRDLKEDELRALEHELADISMEDFINDIKLPLLKKVDYFTMAQLHKLIEDFKELEELKRHLGIKSFDELYEN